MKGFNLVMNNESLMAGARQLGVSLNADQHQQLESYLTLLKKWNRVYNLTAVTDADQMVKYHLLDSLVLLPYLQNSQGDLYPLRIADIGSGAGVPGIVLAIVCPQHQYYLLDSNGKKTRFLTQVKIELGLDNCTIIHDRSEKYEPPVKFDLLVSRAFATLKNFIDSTKDLIKPGGHIIAMKGKYPLLELEDLPDTVTIQEVLPVRVPFLSEERHLVIIKNSPLEAK